MSVADFLPDAGHLEESIRVDREAGDRDDQRVRLISDFRVTQAAESFFGALILRIRGASETDRRGWNHWLYGYYGSGKSHLLALCGCLLDSEWVEPRGKEKVWSLLAKDNPGLDELHEEWEKALDQYHVRPISLNLLKYQGVEGKSFGELLLNAVHESGGFSPHFETASFEKWYRTTDAWETREDRAEAILSTLGIEVPNGNVWARIQEYRALAELVLPRLFAEEMGDVDGYYDLAARSMRPGSVATELERWRAEIEEEKGKPSKLVLLLDEVSLFIGARYGLLTELNSLAENIDEEGAGDIITVVTAQEKIDEVTHEYARKRLNFSILEDRFPHQYSLPSRHVGEIVQGRLLTKDESHRTRLIEEVLSEASVRPEDSLVFRNVVRNTAPPLDRFDQETFLDYYPLLPYHLPLFLEILHGLREDISDQAKSIFSGTARAGLAIAANLLEEWKEEDNPFRVISLPEFYDVVEPELKAAIPNKVHAIQSIKEDVESGKLERLDLKVTKAILLLSSVDDMVDSTDHQNIAVAVMDDLNGPSRLSMANRVENALERLGTYVRRYEREGARSLRFTDQEEREILEEAKELEEQPLWGDLMRVIGDQFWHDLMDEVGLPEEVTYPHGDDVWPIEFDAALDGHRITKSGDQDRPLKLLVHVKGLVESGMEVGGEEGAIIWRAGTEGVDQARGALLRWAALAEAASRHRIPDSIRDDLADQKARALDSVAGLLRKGSFKAGPEKHGTLSRAIEGGLEERYPRFFHPAMLHVGASDLKAVREVSTEESLPAWIETLRIPTSEADQELGPLAEHVRAIVGRTLMTDGPLSVRRLLITLTESDRMLREESVEEALAATIWGLCRRGDFRAVDADGHPLQIDDLLDPDAWDQTRLTIQGDQESARSHLEKLPSVETTDDFSTAVLKLERRINRLRLEARSLLQSVQDQNEAFLTEGARGLLRSFSVAISEWLEEIERQSDALGEPTPEWAELVGTTLELVGQVSGAHALWKDRKTFLLHLDALLALGEQDPEWLSSDADDRLATLRGQVTRASDVAWWLQDGWATLRDRLDALNQVREQITTSWEEHLDRAGRRSLLEHLQGSPWLRPPHELPQATIQPEFQRAVLRPLRGFRQRYSRESAVVAILGRSPTEVDPQELDECRDDLATGEPHPEESDETIRELSRIAQRFEKLVADRDPEAVAGLGVWPRDRDGLVQILVEIVESQELAPTRLDDDLLVS